VEYDLIRPKQTWKSQGGEREGRMLVSSGMTRISVQWVGNIWLSDRSSDMNMMNIRIEIVDGLLSKYRLQLYPLELDDVVSVGLP
jgi:hypothetical protein